MGALRRHPILAAVAAAVVLATTGLVAVWAISRQHCFTLTGSVVCRVATDQPRIALTFDDGPTERGVAAVLPVLEARGVKATFFLIGQEVAERPHLARRIARAGHELGNHSWSHTLMVGRPGRFYDRELAET
ncbi:MAG: polysaccharide deacetylase family protein, partial [Phenylobacterium sp.]|uniref:polysaccharide deacetylase family protein n=1 Tax=Phenylobacterium sp. TaxID=1871053 RepID=UPI001A3D4312